MMNFVKKICCVLLAVKALLVGMELSLVPPLPDNDASVSSESDFFLDSWWDEQKKPVSLQDSLSRELDVSLPLSPLMSLESKEIKQDQSAKKYPCSDLHCSSFFGTAQECERHIIKDHITTSNPKLKAFLCGMCGQNFTFKNESIAHIGEEHKIFDDQSTALLIHENVGVWSHVKSLVILSLQQSLCNQNKLSDQKSRNSHCVPPLSIEKKLARSDRISQGPYPKTKEHICSFCGKKYKKQQWLTKHILREHQ